MTKPLYKYVGIDGLIDILEKGRLKWSAPKTFNDPFDLQINLLNYDLGEFRRITEEKISEIIFGAENPSDNTKQIYLTLRRKRINDPNTTTEYLKNEIQGISDELLNRERKSREGANSNFLGLEKARVVCLSEIHDDLLMWGHYTKEHRGGVLRFKSGNDLMIGDVEIRKIGYSEERPDNNFFLDFVDYLLKIDVSRFDMAKHLWTKSIHWKYEFEWRLARVASNEDEMEYHGFPPEALEKIYLGCKINPEDKLKVLGLVKNKFSHVKVFQAFTNSKRYELDFSLIQ